MRARLFAAGALIALALSACGGGGDGTGGSGGGSRLVVSTISDPKGLNPAFASATPTLELSALLFSYAVRYDDKARPIPDAVREVPTLANGGVSKDGKTLTYKLRRGIKWHDGQGDLTCADMKSTWKMMVNPKNIIDTTVGWSSIRDIDCRDPYVAVVHMKTVYAPFLQQLWSVNGNSPILPAHIIDKYNDANGDMNQAPFNSAPVGSGPYRFVSWERGSRIRLAAFPQYFLGKPAIDEVVYKVTPDSNTLTTQVQTHEVQIAWNLPAAQLDQLRAASGVRISTPVVYIFDHLDFNLSRPLFADVRVRRALTYAIDRGGLLKKVQHGMGELSPTFLDPSLYKDSYDPTVMQYPYDPGKAKALLEGAGWQPGADGIRTKNGTRLAFEISATAESAAGQRIEQQAIGYWRAIGADVHVKNYPTTLYFDQTSNGILAGAKYDVAVYAWSGAADIDQSAIYSAHFMPPHGQNYPRWKNPVATAAMDRANATIDQPARIREYKIVQQEFAKDDPSIILWFRREIVASPAALRNFSVTPVITVPFWNPWAYRF